MLFTRVTVTRNGFFYVLELFTFSESQIMSNRSLAHPALRRYTPFDPRVKVICNDQGGSLITNNPKDPNGFQKAFYHLSDGTRITFYKAPAQNEEMRVFSLTGYKTDYLMRPTRVRQANAQGVSHYWLALPNTNRANIIHDPVYTETAKLLVKIAYQMKLADKKDVKQVLGGHSTGSRYNLEAAYEDEVFRAEQEVFAGNIQSSAYLDSANASRWFHPKRADLWRGICEKYAELLPNELEYAKFYLSFFGEDSTPARDKGYILPTFGQINDLSRGGFALAERIEKNGHPYKSERFATAFIYSTRDGFSSPKTNERTADNIGAAKIALVSTNHSPINVSNLAHERYLSAVRAMCAGDFETATHTDILHDPRVSLSAKEKALSSFIERAWERDCPSTLSGVRDLAGRAGERGASLFNTLASGTKGLFGRRVGNAEVGAEAEGGTVNSGNTLRLQ